MRRSLGCNVNEVREGWSEQGSLPTSAEFPPPAQQAPAQRTEPEGRVTGSGSRDAFEDVLREQKQTKHGNTSVRTHEQ